MSNELKLSVTTSPHLRSTDTVSQAMRDVIIALSLVTLVSIFWFKWNAVFLVAVCVASAMLAEVVFRKLLGKQPNLKDGSAILTGLLVALCFGPGTAWWTAVLACFIGVGVAKELMGGLGWNRFNPALFGRVSVILLAPVVLNPLNRAFAPLSVNLGTIDTITGATPLALIKQGADLPGLGSLFVAFPGGALAETSALALILGGAYLLYRRHISWHIPVSMIGTVFVIGLIFQGGMGILSPFYHVFAGGVLLGAFFMATDWVTSPITLKGKIVFGVAIGILIMVFRLFLAPVEGTAFSILIMNAFVPMIDRLTRRPRFGEVKVDAAAAPGVTRQA